MESVYCAVVFIIVMESVYCAVRTDSLYKTDYVSSLKGYCVRNPGNSLDTLLLGAKQYGYFAQRPFAHTYSPE